MSWSPSSTGALETDPTSGAITKRDDDDESSSASPRSHQTLAFSLLAYKAYAAAEAQDEAKIQEQCQEMVAKVKKQSRRLTMGANDLLRCARPSRSKAD